MLLLISILIVFVALCSVAFYQGLTIRRYTVLSSKLPANRTCTLLLLSDLHSHSFGKEQKRLLKKLKGITPDLVLLAGDIVDDKVKPAGVAAFFQAKRRMAPVYYVTGNHEIRTGKAEEIKRRLQEGGIHVLDGGWEYITANKMEFFIGGFDDPEDWKRRPKGEYPAYIKQYFSEKCSPDFFHLLLCHRPVPMDLGEMLPVDLALAGHTHGGWMRLPGLINGLYAPDQGVFPKYAGGIFSKGGMTQIVSRGLSGHRWVPRVFNPPEIVVIHLSGTGTKEKSV